MRRSTAIAIVGLVAMAAGCSSPSGTPAATGESSGPAESAQPVVGNWPPGCEAIPLVAPDGSEVELSGTWIDISRTDAAQMTWWIQAQGDCFYGTGTVGEVPEEGPSMTSYTVQTYTGTIRSDFTVDGRMIHLGPRPGFAGGEQIWAEVRLLIEFADDGTVQIREDRVAGEIDPPRCLDPVFCLPPMVLVPRET
jgi:hypothetical protein